MTKHSRIFIKSGSDLFYLMWAQFEVNGDVYMGLTAKGSGGLEQVYDPNLGKVLAKDIVAPQSDESLKISFHASGQYKLAGRMGLSEDALDRVTVAGPQLADISEPRMMAEILLPTHLPRTTRTPSVYDISLDISPGPPPPHRCAIFSACPTSGTMRSCRGQPSWLIRLSGNVRMRSPMVCKYGYGPFGNPQMTGCRHHAILYSSLDLQSGGNRLMEGRVLARVKDGAIQTDPVSSLAGSM